MTRLVGVRAVCDGCLSAAAAVFCVSHRSVVCHACDADQHSSPPSAAHQRVDLASAVTALPFCEYCDDAPATTYCETEGNTLCDKCDRVIHASHPAPAHCRTPISSTLRNRAVEFRGKPRNNTEQPPPSNARPSATTGSRNTLDITLETLDSMVLDPTSSVSPPPGRPSHHQQESSQPQPQPQTPSRAQPGQRRRSSKVLTKRKYRRTLQRPAQSMPLSRFPPENSISGNGSPPILQSGDYSGFLFPYANASVPCSPFVTDNPCTSAPTDPLMGDQNPTYQALQDRQYSADGGTLVQDFNMLPYEDIDVETALEGLNGSKDSSGSGGSSRRKTPDIEILQRQSSLRPPPNTPQAPYVPQTSQAPNVAVVAAAAAAAAAGEMYLLNSVSSGPGSSREPRVTPPLNDVSGTSDPAGVAEAARAAAESAAAAVDLGSAGSSSRAVSSAKPSNLATAAEMQTIGSANGRSERLQRTSRRMNKPLSVESGGVGKTTQFQAQAAQRQKFDEEVRRLDMDTGSSRFAKGAVRVESRLDRPTQEPLTSGGDVNSDVLGQISDGGGVEVLQSGADVMGDLEMSGNDFGMFDSIDLAQFDQNSGCGLEYPLSDFRSRVLDSDEG